MKEGELLLVVLQIEERQNGLLHSRVSIKFILIRLRLCCLEKISYCYLIVFLEYRNGCLLSFSCDFKCLLTNSIYFSKTVVNRVLTEAYENAGFSKFRYTFFKLMGN